MVLNQRINHPLVNADASINLPLLRDWKPQIRLVDVLMQAQEMIFGTGAMTHGNHQAIHHPPSHSSQGSNSPVEQTGVQQQDVIMQMLQHCPNAELQRYLTDPAAYEEFVSIAVAELKVTVK